LDAVPSGANTLLELSKPDCVADDFGGEIVVLNIATGMYYSLRNFAAAVWRDLMAGVDVQHLLAELEAVDGGVSADAAAFIEELQKAGLVRPAGVRMNGITSLQSAEAVSRGDVAIVVEAFDDMREFILSDPIHDADELLGWPTPPMSNR
jgi:hypothetical protein